MYHLFPHYLVRSIPHVNIDFSLIDDDRLENFFDLDNKSVGSQAQQSSSSSASSLSSTSNVSLTNPPTAMNDNSTAAESTRLKLAHRLVI